MVKSGRLGVQGDPQPQPVSGLPGYMSPCLKHSSLFRKEEKGRQGERKGRGEERGR